MLEVRDLVRSFDRFMGVAGVGLSVPQGSISAIIGPDGAGKTTAFNLITGHLSPDSGRVIFKGRDVTGIPPHDLCRLGMGRSFQRTNIFPRLTVYQNVQAAFLSHRGRRWNPFTPVEHLYREQTEAPLDSVGLLAKAGEVGGYLSHGNQNQLDLGIALGLEPEILLLDEPTAGMSAAETRETIHLTERLARERNLTLLFTEHDMEVVFSIAQRITVVHQGRVIADGEPAEVRRHPDVRRVYLGEKQHRGPADLRRPHGVGEPGRGEPPLAEWRLDRRARLRPLPQAPGDAGPAGRLPVGRRAADAHHRAHADGQPRAPAARRAVGGARAPGRGARKPPMSKLTGFPASHAGLQAPRPPRAVPPAFHRLGWLGYRQQTQAITDGSGVKPRDRRFLRRPEGRGFRAGEVL